MEKTIQGVIEKPELMGGRVMFDVVGENNERRRYVGVVLLDEMGQPIDSSHKARVFLGWRNKIQEGDDATSAEDVARALRGESKQVLTPRIGVLEFISVTGNSRTTYIERWETVEAIVEFR